MGFQTQVVAMTAAEQAKKLDKYVHALSQLPPPGCGQGAHRALLGAANYAVLGSVDEDTFVKDIVRSMPRGQRLVHVNEIRNAYRRAASDGGRLPDSNYKIVPSVYKPEMLSKLIGVKGGATINEIRQRSPFRIPESLSEQQSLFLSTLFDDAEYIYVGDMFGKECQTCRDLRHVISCGSAIGPLFCINPLSGRAEQSKSGTLSKRADACVAAFRYCLVEFDRLSLEEQAGFWLNVDLPVAAIVHSGNKSLHALLRVDIPNPEVWKSEIELKLYIQRLAPLGVDTACKNPGRLARMPGFIRIDTQKPQELLYLCPQGKAVGK